MKTTCYHLITLLFLLSATACNDVNEVMLAGGGIIGTGSPEGSRVPGKSVPLLEETATTQVLNVGPITQLDPLTVNGIAYDTKDAFITMDDQQVYVEDLKLGMVVQIEGEQTDTSGTAQFIKFSDNVKGPVQKLEGTYLTILNQRVKVDSSSVLEGLETLAELTEGQWVAVSGLVGVNEGIVATRLALVEPSLAKIRGHLTHFDPATQTFAIGGLLVDYQALQTLEGELGEGRFAEVRGNFSNGQLIADYLTIEETPLGGRPTEDTLLEWQGIISYLGMPGTFKVSHLPVTTTLSTVFVEGTSLDLRVGMRVAVKGYLDAEGKLVGEEVRLLQ